MKLHSRASHSPPAVRPSSEPAKDRYWTSAMGVGTPALDDNKPNGPCLPGAQLLGYIFKVRESGPCFYGIYSLV